MIHLHLTASCLRSCHVSFHSSLIVQLYARHLNILTNLTAALGLQSILISNTLFTLLINFGFQIWFNIKTGLCLHLFQIKCIFVFLWVIQTTNPRWFEFLVEQNLILNQLCECRTTNSTNLFRLFCNPCTHASWPFCHCLVTINKSFLLIALFLTALPITASFLKHLTHHQSCLFLKLG